MQTLPVVAEIKDHFAIRHDESRGLIVFSLTGFLNDEESRNCLLQLSNHWAKARRRHGRVLFLVDASKSEVQSPAILGQLRGASAQTAAKGDRIAFVVASSLLKMQFRRAIRESTAAVEFFMSISAAETWILACEPPALTA